MNSVLVIGASGSIGGLVVDELVQRGAAVRVLVRAGSSAGFPQSTDITDPTAVKDVLNPDTQPITDETARVLAGASTSLEPTLCGPLWGHQSANDPLNRV